VLIGRDRDDERKNFSGFFLRPTKGQTSIQPVRLAYSRCVSWGSNKPCRWCLLFFSLRLPHSVWRKNITEERPTNHPRYCYKVRQLNERLGCKRRKHSSQPHNCNSKGFAPAEIGRDIGPIGSQILAKIAHLFSLAHWIRTQRESHRSAYAGGVAKACSRRLRGQLRGAYGTKVQLDTTLTIRTITRRKTGLKDIQHGFD
jgi:hypothetical protein